MPYTYGEIVRVAFNLMLPLHKCDDGSDDQTWFLPRLRKEQRDGLNPAKQDQ